MPANIREHPNAIRRTKCERIKRKLWKRKSTLLKQRSKCRIEGKIKKIDKELESIAKQIEKWYEGKRRFEEKYGTECPVKYSSSPENTPQIHGGRDQDNDSETINRKDPSNDRKKVPGKLDIRDRRPTYDEMAQIPPMAVPPASSAMVPPHFQNRIDCEPPFNNRERPYNSHRQPHSIHEPAAYRISDRDSMKQVNHGCPPYPETRKRRGRSVNAMDQNQGSSNQSPPPQSFLYGNPTGALLLKLSECFVTSVEDASFALDVATELSKSLKEFSEKNGEHKIAELLMDAELKFSTVKALKVGVKYPAEPGISASSRADSRKNWATSENSFVTGSFS